ncbi:MAG: hypothetical protein ACXVCY_03685 [Pseudobdellovibrionaceae bacterium]
MINQFLTILMTSLWGVLQFSVVHAATKSEAPSYKVNMRVGLKGQSPISINTFAKSGKKTAVSQFSDDGMTETLVEFYTKTSHTNKKQGIYMDVVVTKRVRGESKITERAQLFAPENQEAEFGVNSKGVSEKNLSLAVMAYKL